MNYVHFVNIIGLILGFGLLFLGLFVFKLPIINSFLISLGGFILPILIKVSGVK
jgi:hypothetical protein